MPLFPIRFGTQGPDNFQPTDSIGEFFGGSKFGLGGNDILNGGIFGDQLFGGGGNDLLVGNTGDDTLTGWAGIDKFRFNTLNPFEGDDIITDLNPFNGDAIQFFSNQVAATLLLTGQGYLALNGITGSDLDTSTAYDLTDTGANVVIDTPFGNSITVLGLGLLDNTDSVIDFAFMEANGMLEFI